MFFQNQGVSLEYQELGGSGQPVVLLHGFLGGDVKRDWQDTGVAAALISAGHRVFALLYRAHGRSSAPHGPAAYGQELVTDIIRFLDYLQVSQAHLVGWSMGGMLAANVALRYPARVSRAVLLAGATLSARQYAADTDFQAAIRGSAARLESGSGGFPLISYLAPTDLPCADLSDNETDMLLQEVLTGRDPLALAALLRSWDSLVLPDELLPGATVPVLAIGGTADRPVAHLQGLAASWPGMRLVEIPGADHSFQRVPNVWTQITELLLEFLK